MKLQAATRLQVTAKVNLSKLDFTQDPPEDFHDAFLAKFSGAEARDKLWAYRKAIKAFLGTPAYKKWMAAFDEVENEA
jgi:hypothetical protein